MTGQAPLAVLEERVKERREEFDEAWRQYERDLPNLDQQEWEARQSELDRLRTFVSAAQDAANTAYRIRRDPLLRLAQLAAKRHELDADIDDAIYEAHMSGRKNSAIARASGLNDSTVARRIARRVEKNQVSS